jgi:5-keto 4-deoxyuronate isomerase
VVLAALLDLFIALACVSRIFVRATKVLETYCSEDAPIVGGKVAQSACVQLHIVEARSIFLRCSVDYMMSRREVVVSECMRQEIVAAQIFGLL